MSNHPPPHAKYLTCFNSLAKIDCHHLCMLQALTNYQTV